MRTTSARVAALAAAFVIGLAGWSVLQSRGVAHASHDSPGLGSSTAHAAAPSGVVIELASLRPDDASITFAPFAYAPNVVTITVGESVSWSGVFDFHPLRQVDGPASDTSVSGGFANGTGSFYSVQFNSAGTFYYQCAFHGLAQFGGNMRGSIIVLPAGGSTATPTATSVPPTATPTSPPSATPTATEVPATATPTATQVADPVPTDTPTATPTATETPSPTPTATRVADPVPTDTPTATPTPTLTPTSTPVLVPAAFLPAVLR